MRARAAHKRLRRLGHGLRNRRSASSSRLSADIPVFFKDNTSFFCKGVAGDWKNVFTERDREVFDEAAGDLLIRLGYEEGSSS